MSPNVPSLTSLQLAVAALLLNLLATPRLPATPYATALTNTGAAISFRLNEAAHTVKVLSNGGATEHDLGARSPGLHTVPLTVAGPYQILVTKLSPAGWRDGVALQISDDNAQTVKFWAPRGVAVNRDPSSPHFGRVYVANAQAGTSGGRTVTDGIYLLNADLTDAVDQGDVARDGGINWAATTGDLSKPWRIEVGDDNNLYIADWTEATGGIYVVDGDVAPDSGRKVIDGYIGSSPVARGSLAAGTLRLYALEGLDQPINQARVWDVGSGPLPYDGPGVRLHDGPALRDLRDLTVDLELGPNGKLYLLQNSFDGLRPGLIIADPAVDLAGGGESGNAPNGLADLVYSSLTDTRSIANNAQEPDFLRRARALRISPDGQYLALLHDLGDLYIVPLIDGLPDLARRQYVVGGSGAVTGRDIAFDAAGNLYMVHGGLERLRVFSAGLNSTVTTGSDGTFNVSIQQPPATTVELLATDTHIYERLAPYDFARLTFTRTADTTNPLTVNYAIGGTAIPGQDYQTLNSSVEIPAGELNTILTIVGIDNALFEGDKTIQITLAQGNYNIGSQNTATVVLRDDESAPGTVLWEDTFETDTAASYAVIYTDDAGGTTNFAAAFAYDYGADGIPPAPHSTQGASRGLKLQANLVAPSSPGAVNVYPLGVGFTGDFALRADLYISVGTDVGGTAEHTLLGIHHAGNLPNRHTVSSDGLWFAVDGDASNNRGFAHYEGGIGTPNNTLNNTLFADVFTSPPWGFAGAPNNLTNRNIGASSGRHWAEAEISSIGGIVQFKLNNTVIFTITNQTAYTTGTVMLGHNDQFTSSGSIHNFTLFDNVRVVRLGQGNGPSILITAIRVENDLVTIDFTSDAPDAPSAFILRRSALAEGLYSPDPGAVITERLPPGAGLYRAETTVDEETRFYFLESTAP